MFMPDPVGPEALQSLILRSRDQMAERLREIEIEEGLAKTTAIAQGFVAALVEWTELTTGLEVPGTEPLKAAAKRP